MRVKEVLCLYPRRRWRYKQWLYLSLHCSAELLKVEKVGQARMMDAKKTQRETRKEQGVKERGLKFKSHCSRSLVDRSGHQQSSLAGLGKDSRLRTDTEGGVNADTGAGGEGEI